MLTQEIPSSRSALSAGLTFRFRRAGNRRHMANPAPIGSDVSAGTYRCTNCGNEIQLQSVQSLPPCPSCGGPNDWEAVSGGDSAQDPYPNN
jgi:hypothetical protein